MSAADLLQRALLASPLLAARTASAHGFGERYDLPLPLWSYLAAAGLTVALSFAMLARFARDEPGAPAPDGRTAWTLDGRLARALLFGARLAVVLLYVLAIVAGFIGSQKPLKNLAPALIWGIWWVGFGYASAIIGNLWGLLNPLDTLWAWGEALVARVEPPASSRQRRALPAWLGAWPAATLFVAFTWMELAWDGSDVPAHVATLIVAYSAIIWIGRWRFGAQWLRHADVFAIVFGILARFAPLEISASDPPCVVLRPYGVGLLAERPLPLPMIVLVLAVLAGVSVDGFIETPAWAAIVAAFAGDAPTAHREAAVTTVGVLAAPGLFFAVYLGVCALTARAGGQASGTLRIAGLFVQTLVPISIGYHIAHYLTLFAMAGQYLIPLASDPFGWNWNLFGGGTWFLRPGIVGARLLWVVSVTAIVVGHVAAVYLSHRQAVRTFGSRRAALYSQLPMLVLMIAYTMSSLWIIAQPIVR